MKKQINVKLFQNYITQRGLTAEILFFPYHLKKNIVVQLQLSPFFPPLLSLALPTPTSHIQSSSPSLSLSMGPLYIFLDLTLPLLSPVIPLSPPLWSLSVSFFLFINKKDSHETIKCFVSGQADQSSAEAQNFFL